MAASIETLEAVHRFWCGHLPRPEHFPAEKAGLWFERSEATDDFIRATFGADLDAVAARDWPLEAMSPAAAIGLVIMLDQFPRNLFREDPRAFAYDPLARRHARLLVANDAARFALIERVFLYLPFEHSEAIADQELSVALYEALLVEAPADQLDLYRNYLDFAVKHRDLISRFGRFPHRNAILGRASTADEEAFLSTNGRGY